MSDIQELIYKVSMDCIEKGKRDEQERIIKLLEEIPDHYWTRLGGFDNKLDRQELIALIKGEK